MDFIAHIRERDKRVQTVKEHLLGTKDLAEVHGEKLGIKHIVGLAGLLHDLGKFSMEFQNYIRLAVENPERAPRRGTVDHSTAGAKLLYEMFHDPAKDFSLYTATLAEVVGNAIISHHSYLRDFLSPVLSSDYLRRVHEKELSEFELLVQRFFTTVMDQGQFRAYVNAATEELKKYLSASETGLTIRLFFLSKFVFGALIDADRTNTRLFEEGYSLEELDVGDLFGAYYLKLMDKLNSFQNRADASTPINRWRSEMSSQCEKFAYQPSGIYTLSIPTGGGKTLASLRYALRHAKEYDKKRIIYVVPFTTIIEQNAREVRNLLEDEVNILEHHSNVVEDVDDDEKEDGVITASQRLRLARDNWSAPIIFTTMVQFLNVFYAKGNSSVRRLHNLTDAVIIFDEVQKVPIKCLSLFNHALNFLKTRCRCSIVLCTATQPALDFVEHKLRINKDAEIVRITEPIREAFKRVNIVDRATSEVFDNDKLVALVSDRLSEVQSVLIILNTTAVVRDLYIKLSNRLPSVPIFHLSAAMCAKHRTDRLEQVRKHLANNEKVICVSTQLVEAGVDISFACVIRSLAGLDSIAQACGRCNRHGEHGIQNVYLVDHAEENLDRLPEIRVGKRITKEILTDLNRDPRSHGGDILSQRAMTRYFNRYYQEFKTVLDYPIPELRKSMLQLLFEGKRDEDSYSYSYERNKGTRVPLAIANSYGTAAENFHVIEDRTVSAIVPYGQGKELIADLNSVDEIGNLGDFLRKAQLYSVNLYGYQRDLLEKKGGIVSFLDGKVLALKPSAYSAEFGVDLSNETMLENLIY